MQDTKDLASSVRKDLNRGFSRTQVVDQLTQLGFGQQIETEHFVAEVDAKRRRNNRTVATIWLVVGFAMASMAFVSNCAMSVSGGPRSLLVWLAVPVGIAIAIHAYKALKRNRKEEDIE